MSKYHVLVDDNFHYMDEKERRELGAFATLEDALAACRAFVDHWLVENHKPGMTGSFTAFIRRLAKENRASRGCSGAAVCQGRGKWEPRRSPKRLSDKPVPNCKKEARRREPTGLLAPGGADAG